VRDLAAAPEGDWLRPHLDGAPRAVRLAASAGYLGRGAYGLKGVDLWAELVLRYMPGERVPDVPTLRILWALAWPRQSGVVPRDEQHRVTEVCSARLVFEAGHELSLEHWLRHPGRFDNRPDDGYLDRYLDLARVATGSNRLGNRERATARLVVLAHDLARGEEPLADALQQLPALEERVGRLEPGLRDLVDAWIARGIARTDPREVRRTHALYRYAVGDLRLLDHYRAAVRQARREDGALDARVLRDPQRVADLFVLWEEPQQGETGAWRDLTKNLIGDVIGGVLRHMDQRDLGAVSTVLARWGGEPWVQAWTAWQHRLR
jgi:hypothetical protein